MTLVYFDDLCETKLLALEMAEVDLRMLKLEEAKLLVNQLRGYYLHSNADVDGGDDKNKLLNAFNKSPATFKHMEIIRQLEKDNVKIENSNANPK